METLTSPEILRTNIRILQARSKINNTELAKRLNVSQSAIGNKLLGKREWKIQELDSVASVFDTTPWDLMKPMLGDTWRPRQESNLQPRDYSLGMRWVNTFF